MENVILIFGCGHSGTTIMNKIISSHKNIYGVDYETEVFLKNPMYITITFLNQLNQQRLLSKKKWLCEKTPRHVHFISKIYKLIKKPKIIVMVRDGRDVVASLNKRYNDFNKSVNRWIDNNNTWLNSPYKNDFYVLRYEDFIKNPKEELEKICNYIGEEFDENMLNYKKDEINLPFTIDSMEKINHKDHEALRKYQTNQQIYDGSKRYLKDLTKEQLDSLYANKEFMELMKKFNYLK